MRICYLDESGTPELTGSTSHFILLGLSIQGESWREKDAQITAIKRRYGLERAEIHTGWIARRYLEQEKIKGFDELGSGVRREAVQKSRDEFLVRKAALRGVASVETLRKTFRKTAPYIHLTMAERRELLREVVRTVGAWDDCRLFAECIDKRTFGGKAPVTPPFEEAFTQIVTRFHRFLAGQAQREHGLLVQDNNDTMARRLTELMRLFHREGNRWSRELDLIIETPLFVDSELTSLVQVADVCAYATRRFCENGETDLFDPVYPRVNRDGTRLVGMRHYTNRDAPSGRRCGCRICIDH